MLHQSGSSKVKLNAPIHLYLTWSSKACKWWYFLRLINLKSIYLPYPCYLPADRNEFLKKVEWRISGWCLYLLSMCYLQVYKNSKVIWHLTLQLRIFAYFSLKFCSFFFLQNFEPASSQACGGESTASSQWRIDISTCWRLIFLVPL